MSIVLRESLPMDTKRQSQNAWALQGMGSHLVYHSPACREGNRRHTEFPRLKVDVALPETQMSKHHLPAGQVLPCHPAQCKAAGNRLSGWFETCLGRHSHLARLPGQQLASKTHSMNLSLTPPPGSLSLTGETTDADTESASKSARLPDPAICCQQGITALKS